VTHYLPFISYQPPITTHHLPFTVCFLAFSCKTNPICTNPAKFSPRKANPNKAKQTQSDPHFSLTRAPQSQNEPKQTQNKPNLFMAKNERNFPSHKGLWQCNRLQARTHQITALAKQHNIWVVLGSAHYISEKEKPTNCLYIISDKGRIVDRYDKSMLTGGDLEVYTPGNHFVTIKLKGFKCGFLICYDICYPEMYNAYRHKGVKLMFHSFYNARLKGKTILDEIKPAWVRVRAADNRMWVIASNSSGHYSSWASCIARPDGSLVSLEKGVPGILYREFPDTESTDEFRSWTHNKKMMALPKNEVYHNGKPSNHARATDTRSPP
jgi:predicted amidohydrolase